VQQTTLTESKLKP